MRFVRLTTATGAQEPASLEDLKDYARIVSTDEDRVLEQLLLSARQEVERYSGHVLVPGTFQVLLDSWSASFEMPMTPVRSVTSLSYYSAAGVATVVDPTTYYFDPTAQPARLVLSTWYAVEPWSMRGSASVVLEVVAGYETRADVPEDIRQHVMTQALLMYQHRDDPTLLEKVRRYAATGSNAFAVVTA